MDYYARRNGKSNEFRIANITSIQAFGGDLKDQLLKESENETHYVERPADQKIKLTDISRSHCNDY